ncbi:MAG: 2-oxoacid:acceptor oxidoreductase family protein [Candidatus Omnitrophota bacterium]
MNNINESIICSGFGGQGIMVLGKFLANTGLSLGLHVTWLPSYGAEVRGGTAHAMIRIATDPIGNPVVSDATVVIIMNNPSFDKFEKKVMPGGLLILNDSMVDKKCKRDDIDIIEASLTDEAILLGNVKVSNMIAVGIYAARKKMFNKELLIKTIEQMAAGREALVSINIKAIERGMELGKQG